MLWNNISSHEITRWFWDNLEVWRHVCQCATQRFWSISWKPPRCDRLLQLASKSKEFIWKRDRAWRWLLHHLEQWPKVMTSIEVDSSNVMETRKHLIRIVPLSSGFCSLAGAKMRLRLLVCYMISMGILFTILKSEWSYHSSYGRARNNWTLQCKINFNW